MADIRINSSNIAEYSWLLDFFAEDLNKQIAYWHSNKTYSYKNIKFKFEQDIFPRYRKNSSEIAYEMKSFKALGNGVHGYVYPISVTLSYGKNKSGFQAKDKNRVVKVQDSYGARNEYQIAQYAPHLHAKQPHMGYMVMRNLGDSTLENFLKTSVSRSERLLFTKGLLKAYKEQVVDLNLSHDDLHRHYRNFLVKEVPDSPHKFEINIVDYGLAEFLNSNTKNRTPDFSMAIVPIIRAIWNPLPLKVKTLINDPKRSDVFSEYEKVFDDLLISPWVKHQIPVDYFQFFLDNLANCNQIELASQLKQYIAEALSTENIDNFNESLQKCRALLKENNISIFPMIKFEKEPEKYALYNRLEESFQSLQTKANFLKSNENYQTEGKSLSIALLKLREITLDAIHSPEGRIEKINECQSFLTQLLNENKKGLEIHRNYNYILAEIAVVLGSLIIFYPLVFGLNYAIRGKLGFFSETNSLAATEEIEQEFEEMKLGLA
ncbi:MAG: hypothetical protein H0U57_00225 [Tatlockia sp.]|nr:hypothetical protein [Tatlockia sp.]